MEEVAKKLAGALRGYEVRVFPKVSRIKSRKEELQRQRMENHKVSSSESVGVAIEEEMRSNNNVALIISKIVIPERSDSEDGLPLTESLSVRTDVPVPGTQQFRTSLGNRLSKLNEVLSRHNLRLDYLIHDHNDAALVSIARKGLFGTKLGWLGHRGKFVKLLEAELNKQNKRGTRS